MLVTGLKITGCLVSGAAACSLAANLWVAGERRLADTAISLKDQAVASIVASEGYIKPVALPAQNRKDTIEEAARTHKISSSFVRAVIKAESEGNQKAISEKGAIGLMQVMPANAGRCGLPTKALYNEAENIACGTQILAEEYRLYQDGIKALVAYNGGPKAVAQLQKCGANLPNGAINKKCLGGYVESVNYAQKVIRALVIGQRS